MSTRGDEAFGLAQLYARVSRLRRKGRRIGAGTPTDRGQAAFDAEYARILAILGAMSPGERCDPSGLDEPARGRIALQAGVAPREVESLLRQSEGMARLIAGGRAGRPDLDTCVMILVAMRLRGREAVDASRWDGPREADLKLWEFARDG